MNYKLNTHKIPIKDWYPDQEPQKRLVKHGATSLTDVELLAILIGAGKDGRSSLACAGELYALHHSSLANMASKDFSSYKSAKGLGEVKAIIIAAAFELGKRINSETFVLDEIVDNPEVIARLYIPKFANQTTERFLVLLLNSSMKIIRELEISRGTVNESVIHPREIFKTAISESATSIIMLHNHPSGNAKPSKADINATREIVSAGEIIGIEVLDHIIIAGNDFTSLAQSGLL